MRVLPTAAPASPLPAGAAPAPRPRRALLAGAAAWLATPFPAPAAPEIARVHASVTASLKARDEAMDFKCKGGMFDCDSDRRAYAKKQWQSFLARDGKKKEGAAAGEAPAAAGAAAGQ